MEREHAINDENDDWCEREKERKREREKKERKRCVSNDVYLSLRLNVVSK